MIPELKEWIRLQIAKHRESLLAIYKRDNIDVKKVMSGNEFQTLPNDALKELYSIDALSKVATFIDGDIKVDINETMSAEEMASVLYSGFAKDFQAWTKKNEVPFIGFQEWLKKRVQEGMQLPDKNELFRSAQRNIFMWAVLFNQEEK